MLKLIFLNALRNIGRNKLRTFFSVFVISSMVLLFVILHTISGMLTEQFSRTMMQYDIALQSRYSNSPMSSHIGYDVYAQLKNDQRFSDVGAFSIIRFSRNNKRLWIVGVSDLPVFASKFGILIQKGRTFEKGKSELIAGNAVVNVLRQGIGKKIQLNTKDSFKITGIFTSYFTLLNSAAVMDLEVAKKLNPSKKNISMIMLNTKAEYDIDEVVRNLRHSYPMLTAMKTKRIAKSMTTLRDISRLTFIITWLVFITASIAILNTLLITTMQRTKEIGILSAIGWPKSMIVSIFLTESMLLSTLAAAGGLALSNPLLWVIRNYTSLSIYIPGTITVDVIYKVLVMAFFVGLVGVLAPLFYIFKMNISKALRHE